MIVSVAEQVPKCAVLLAVYNGLPYLKEQIKTILDQKDINLTVFVSIDVSTDESEAWLNELASEDSRIVILVSGERFGGAGRNFYRLIRDVDFSQFDFVAFSDQDDHWFPDKLARATKILLNSNFDGYSSNVIAFWANERQKLINKSQAQCTWDFIFEAAGPGCTYVMTLKLITKIKVHMLNNWQALQEVSLHDWYCYAFARAKGYHWFIDPKPSMRYRQHEKNQVGVNCGLKAYLSRVRKIKNGWWLTQALLIAELVGLSQTPFIQSWSKLGSKEFLRLAIHTVQCRRRRRERILFFIICLSLALTGGQQRYEARFRKDKKGIKDM